MSTQSNDGPDPYGEDMIIARIDLAGTIAAQAQALADCNFTGPEHAQVARLLENVKMLAAWTPDDRTR